MVTWIQQLDVELGPDWLKQNWLVGWGAQGEEQFGRVVQKGRERGLVTFRVSREGLGLAAGEETYSLFLPA